MPPQDPTSSTSPTPTKLPETDGFDFAAFRATKDAEKFVAWVKEQHSAADQARSAKKLQWFQNMSMFYGNHWANKVNTPNGIKLATPKAPYYRERRTINRTRSFVRAEHSKYLSSIPSAIAVPSTAEDEDVRAAYAAEQVWESLSDTKKLRQQFTKAAWWTIVTGNGFIKTWWDTDARPDPDNSSIQGDIRFGAITPFHLFVPDLREQEIEDQPFVINAYNKTIEWCRIFFAKELEGVTLSADARSANTILEEGYLNLASGNNQLDSVTVFEMWAKPGAHRMLPEGGVVTIVGDTLVSMIHGMPYRHQQYPFAKFEHIPTATFYADSPLVDTNQLQREYNQLRTEISEAGRRMARPQLLAAKGSVITSMMTNEIGSIIQYRPGMAPPTPLPLSPLPEYYVSQQDRILSDWEDITGQHEVSRGQAPAGVTAGTAINYLQEKDDSFLTPQYQSIEDGYEKMAQQSLQLFVQYVDVQRKIKTIGTDQAFDTQILSGADIKNGTDIRIQRGSSVGQSQAAREAKIMDMFSLGIIQDPNLALKLLEVGGPEKVLDIMNVAERKAQRENMKMKLLTDDMIDQHEMSWQQEQMMGGDPQMGEPSAQVPEDGDPAAPPQVPPVIPVDDFDVHQVHVDVHDKFRMGQEYELLSPAVKAQFAAHINMHKAILQQQMIQQFLQQVPGDGSENDDAGFSDDTDPSSAGGAPDATMAPEGAPAGAPPSM